MGREACELSLAFILGQEACKLCLLLLLWMGGLQTLVFNFSLGWLMRFVFCLTSRSSDYEIYLVFPLDQEYMRYDVSCLSFGVRKGHEIYLLPLPCASGSRGM